MVGTKPHTCQQEKRRLSVAGRASWAASEMTEVGSAWRGRSGAVSRVDVTSSWQKWRRQGDEACGRVSSASRGRL